MKRSGKDLRWNKDTSGNYELSKWDLSRSDKNHSKKLEQEKSTNGIGVNHYGIWNGTGISDSSIKDVEEN